MADETTPDAERQYQDSDGNPCDLVTLCRREPEWAANRLTFERARHAEEVARLRDVHLGENRALDDLRLKEIASLRDQLRRVEGERDALAVRMDLPASQLLMVGSELCGDGKIDPNDHRDPRWTPTLQQAAKVMRELTALRSLLPDVRACARFTYRAAAEGQLVPEFSSAQKLLAADFLREGGE